MSFLKDDLQKITRYHLKNVSMPSEFDKNEKPWFFGPQRISRTETVKVLFINPDSDIESKKDVIDRLSSNLKNGVINQDTGFLLQASRSDAKKTVFRKDLNSPIVKAIFKNAKEIASSSLHIESHCDLLHENEKVQAIHIFAVPAIIEGDLFRVELTVRDYVERDHERKMVHSIDGISIQRYEKAFVWEPPAQEVASKGTLQKTGQPTNERYSSIVNENIKSIPLYRLLSGYIRADGKKYFDNVSLEEFGLDGVYQSSVRQLYVNQFLFRKFANNFKEVLEKNKFPLSTRNRQLLFLNFEIAADDFWLNSQGLTTNLQSLEKIISNQAAYQKLSPNVVAIFEATRRQIVQNSLPFQLSEQGKKILKLHVEALSTKYPSIEDASEEVVRLYKKFSELEKSGKPLPDVPKPKDKGDER